MIKERILKIVDSIKEDIIDLSKYIYDNPELGYEEYKSCAAHVNLLKKYGFQVEERYLGIETAFKAVYDSGKGGAVISYLAEYDALPGMGHGCGHNILGATSTGAGIGLSKLVDEIGGKVVVFGTPAEETSGAKVTMAENGAFDDVDVALIVHPYYKYVKSGSSLALDPIQFTFRGKTSHAAAAPEKGINALDACIAAFNSINYLREHMLPSSRVHGVIIEGGKAANIVPDLAIAQFYVRTTTKSYLKELSEKVKNCAIAGSIATGATLEITNFELGYDNLITNNKLQECYLNNLKDYGIDCVEEPEGANGSTDVGNVSHACPTIHPSFGICSKGTEINTHTVEFAEATLTEVAKENMIKTICSIVKTGYDVIESDELLNEIKEEFRCSLING